MIVNFENPYEFGGNLDANAKVEELKSPNRKIRALQIETREVKVFDTIKQCIEFFNCDKRTITRRLTGAVVAPFKDWIIYYDDMDAGFWYELEQHSCQTKDKTQDNLQQNNDAARIKRAFTIHDKAERGERKNTRFRHGYSPYKPQTKKLKILPF